MKPRVDLGYWCHEHVSIDIGVQSSTLHKFCGVVCFNFKIPEDVKAEVHLDRSLGRQRGPLIEALHVFRFRHSRRKCGSRHVKLRRSEPEVNVGYRSEADVRCSICKFNVHIFRGIACWSREKSRSLESQNLCEPQISVRSVSC
jgi:hypothetical protein